MQNVIFVFYLFIMKVCVKCKKEYPLNMFHKNGNMKSGILNSCKKCGYDYLRKKDIKKIKSKNIDLIPLTGEIFKRFNDYLLASNYGRVYQEFHKYGNRYYSSKFKKQTLMPNGYYSVSIRGKHYNVHRVVAELFVSNPYNKRVVNHLDFNKKNNYSTNLEWCSLIENTNYSVIEGRYSKKLTIDEVKNILKSNLSIDEIAKSYNVSKTNIRLIKNRKIWRHVN